MGEFRKQLQILINKNSMENGSDTPDFVLAEYLTDTLVAFDKAVIRRTKFFGGNNSFEELLDKEVITKQVENKSTINYVVGDATAPQGDGAKIIAHVCNDIGAWGAGFVIPLAKKFPKAKEGYKKLFDRGALPIELGYLQFVDCHNNIYVANMIGQRDIKPGLDGLPPIRYDAIRSAFQKMAKAVHEADNRGTVFTVHMPKIGAGLAGGDWTKIAQIIQEELVDKKIGVTVYELPHEVEYATSPDQAPTTDVKVIDITIDESKSQLDILRIV